MSGDLFLLVLQFLAPIPVGAALFGFQIFLNRRAARLGVGDSRGFMAGRTILVVLAGMVLMFALYYKALVDARFAHSIQGQVSDAPVRKTYRWKRPPVDVQYLLVTTTGGSEVRYRLPTRPTGGCGAGAPFQKPAWSWGFDCGEQRYDMLRPDPDPRLFIVGVAMFLLMVVGRVVLRPSLKPPRMDELDPIEPRSTKK